MFIGNLLLMIKNKASIKYLQTFLVKIDKRHIHRKHWMIQLYELEEKSGKDTTRTFQVLIIVNRST